MQKLALVLDSKPLSKVLVRLISLRVDDAEVESITTIQQLKSLLYSGGLNYVLIDHAWLSADPHFEKIGPIIEQYPNCVFTALLNEYDSDLIYWATAIGFRSVIVKAATPNAIAEAVVLSQTGDPVFPTPPDKDANIRDFTAAQVAGLNDFEQDILRRVMLGHSPSKIGQEKAIPPQTIKKIVLRLVEHLRGKRS